MNSPEDQLPAEPKPEKPATPYRLPGKFLASVLLILALLAGMLSWVMMTQAGTRSLFQLLQMSSSIQTKGVSGRLADHLQIRELSYQTPDSALHITEIDLNWQPLALLQAKLLIDRLHIATVKQSNVPDQNPLAMPVDLVLPLSLELRKVSVERLILAELEPKVANLTHQTHQATEIPNTAVEYLNLHGRWDYSAQGHQISAALVSPWGQINGNLKLAQVQPFAMEGELDYLSNELSHSSAFNEKVKAAGLAALPQAKIHATLQGSLAQLKLQANVQANVKATEQANEQETKAVQTRPILPKNKQEANSVIDGHLTLVVRPFATPESMIRSLKVDLNAIDPALFVPTAPHARLSIQADFQTPVHLSQDGTSGKLPVLASDPRLKLKNSRSSSASVLKQNPQLNAATAMLSGSLIIKNSLPAKINEHGLPLQQFRSLLSVSAEGLQLKEMLISLPGNGKLHGSMDFKFPKSTDQQNLPQPLKSQLKPKQQVSQSLQFNTHLSLSDVNLALLDGRLKATQISGGIESQTKPAQSAQSGQNLIVTHARLSDPRARLNARFDYVYSTQKQSQLAASKNSDGLLSLKQFELIAGDAQIAGQGEWQTGGQQKFNFQGKLLHFDPTRWVNGPAGKIDADLKLQGQLLPKINLNLELSKLQGLYAGQEISGQAQLNWRSESFLTVQNLELRFGKNSLSAQGSMSNLQQPLQIKVDASELSHLNPVLDPWFNLQLAGSVKGQAQLSGQPSELSLKLELNADNLLFLKKSEKNHQQISIRSATAKLDWKNARHGSVNGEVQLKGIGGGNFSQSQLTEQLASVHAAPATSNAFQIDQAVLNLQGFNDAHQLTFSAHIDTERDFKTAASGALDLQNWRWDGVVSEFNFSSKRPPVSAGFIATSVNMQTSNSSPAKKNRIELSLQQAMPVQLSADAIHLGTAQFKLSDGLINLQEFDWNRQQIKTRGSLTQIKLLEVLHLIKPQNSLDGDLKVAADWDLNFQDNLRGQLNLNRQSGDLRILDGNDLPLAMGIEQIQMQVNLGGLVVNPVANSTANSVNNSPTTRNAERITLQLRANGTSLGNWQLNAETQAQKNAGSWSIAADAASKGELHAEVPDLQWMGPSINPGLALKGKLKLDAAFSGFLNAPQYQAQIEGRELELAFASEGLLLPNGTLSAEFNEQKLILKKLQFTNKISMMPAHKKFRGINWIGNEGELNASGIVDLKDQSGNFDVKWTKFPLLQRKDRWIILSGDNKIEQKNKVWTLKGKIVADGGYFKLPKMPAPVLSGDVVVVHGKTKSAQELLLLNREEQKKGIKTQLDVLLDLGPNFVFVGSGLDTGLQGDVRLRSQDNSNQVHASGAISAVDGVYEGYGQQLSISRGILNFQGSPANPSLNIRALRLGLPVEAGVEVVGTVAAPQVRLVSEPEVTDVEKLSWLVLGRAPSQVAGGDATLLLSAANAIFGGQNARNIPKDIVNGLGFDEFSIGPAELGGNLSLPGQTVAGTISGSALARDQVVRIGKSLRPGLVLSVERGLSDASGALKLSWQLTRRISIIGRKGTESSVDMYYTFSFH